MNFLSIDCSTDIGSLFVKTKSKTFTKALQSDKFHNDLLMQKILDFFEDNNLKFEDITHIFVNQGPGSFSGLRGSLAVAKGISLSKNLKLFGYNTFLWSCAKFFKKKDFIYSLIKLRDKYFIKKFDINLNSVSKPEEIKESEIIKNYSNKFTVIAKSSIGVMHEKILKFDNLNIIDLDHNELELLQLKDLLDKNLIKPLYLS